MENKKTLVRLWVHEVSARIELHESVCVVLMDVLFVLIQVYRVYYDRLIDAKDRNWLFELLKNMVKNHFKEDFAVVFKHLSPSGKITDDDMRSLMFGDYMHPDAVSQ